MKRLSASGLNRTLASGFLMLFCAVLVLSCSDKSGRKGKISNITRSGVSYRDMTRKGDKFREVSEYDSAYHYYELAEKMLDPRQAPEEFFGLLLKEIDVLRLKGKTDEASEKITLAQGILKSDLTEIPALHADLLHRAGLILMDKGSFDSSAIVFNQSINIRITNSGKNDTLLAPSFNGLGTIFFYKGDYDAALLNYTKAYDLALKRINPEDADLARYLQNIGIINAQKGAYIEAEKAMTASLGIIEKTSAPDDPDLANRYLNMGRFMTLEYNITEALSFFQKAEKILTKKVGANHPDLGSLYQNMGQAYIHMADYEKALTFFNKALAIATINLEPGHPNILAINMNIGYVYEKKAEFDNALKYYEQSLPDDLNSQAAIKTWSNMASLYNSMNNTLLADTYYNKAIKLAQSILGDNHPETGLLLTRYGYFLISRDQADRSLTMFSKALEISRKNYGDKSREVSNNLTHIGNYYLIKNDLKNALASYQQAIIAIVKDFNSAKTDQNPGVQMTEPDRYLVNALNGKAEALSIAGGVQNLRNSLETYKLSIKVVEKLRSTYQNEESKLLLSEDERKTFLSTVKVSSDIYRLTADKKYLEEAFRYSDKGKSAVLFASLQDVEARQFGKIPVKVQNLEKRLRVELGSYNRYIYEERQKSQPSESKIRFWESKVFELDVKYDSLIKVLEKDYPDYYALKYKEPDVPVESIKKQLEPGRAVVEYTLTDSVVYIFVINKQNFDLITQRIDSSFFRDIEALRNATGSGDLMSTGLEDYQQYTTAAYQLYLNLIAPVEKLVDEKKLIIIPDSEIGYISFDMLLNQKPDQKVMDFRNLAFLIREYVISYSASAMLQFSGINPSAGKASRNLLAMAPSYDNLTNLKEDGFTDETGKKVYLLPIPGVEDEINGIRKALNGNTISGKNATEKKFKEIAGKYNILHLAMHTLMNNEKPTLSKLVFYQDKDSIEDGMLNTYELFGMNLNAGLAVLSACNTGTGRLMKGEGVMNLARGFIYAGVPGIVMTLWSVEDQSSAEIVENFYGYLRDGMSKDEALRQAKLDLINQGDPLRSHPYYWAAYVTIGDYSPMKFVKPLGEKLLFYVIGLLAISGLAITLLRRKSQA